MLALDKNKWFRLEEIYIISNLHYFLFFSLFKFQKI